MARRKLGQNFLYDPRILRRIVAASGVGPADKVLEIGPGTGTLTRELLRAAGSVVAVELDLKLFRKLQVEFESEQRLELVHADALRYPLAGLGAFKVVANIPYQITTPLIFRLLGAGPSLGGMTLTVQKEVAQRIAAGPGGKDYGVLSIAVQFVAEPRVEFTIPAGAFKPVPKVDSACISFKITGAPRVEVKDEATFFKVVRRAFGQRRKTLHNSLGALSPEMDDIILAAGVEPGLRPEVLGLNEFAAISDGLFELAGD